MTPIDRPTRRLFFALWPDPATRRAVVAQAETLGKPSRRPVPEHNLHLTLVFLGTVPGDRVDALLDGAGRIRAAPFALRLDRFGAFPGPRVVWLGGEAPAAGRELVDALADLASACGVEVDGRPWRPHVTLYRGVGRAPAARPTRPIDWQVESFELIESIPSRPYQVLRSWRLE